MRRPRRRLGCIGSLLALLALIAVVVGALYGADALLFAPWAYGIFGPTLTGDWTGTLRTLNGTPYVVHLQLNRSRTDRGTPENSFGRADLDGRLSWCAPRMPSTTAAIDGLANRSASNVTLETSELHLHPHPGLFPYHFQGAFHGSTLVLRVTFRLFQNHGFVYSTSIPDEVTSVRLIMHKAGLSTYRAGCGRV